MKLRCVVAIVALAAACSSGTPQANAPSSTPAPSTATRSPASSPPAVVRVSPTPRPTPSRAAPVAGPTKVLTIVEENHGYAAALRDMPFLAGLADTYGQATAYQNLTHPSLPNYLGLAGGSTFAVHDDAGPSSHPLPGASVFDAALAAGHGARTYAEGMSRTCQTGSAGRYAVKHNPWAYFVDSRRACRTDDLPSGTTSTGALHDDIVHGTLPNVGLVIPDLCHDAHDCSLATADHWLQQWMAVVMAGPDWRAGRLAVVVTFDEDEGYGGQRLLTVVATPLLHHVRTSTRLDHLSWCRWMTDLVGARPLRQAAGATSLGAAFGLPR